MEVKVLSQKQAVEYAKTPHKINAAIVSITTVGDEFVNFPDMKENGISSILRLPFNDVSKGQAHCMSKMQAYVLANFVLQEKDSIDMLIIHCDAGISRSAGVGAAIMKALTGSDMAIFDNPGKRPNMDCYRLVLEVMLEKLGGLYE